MERNGGRSNAGTADPTVQPSAARLGFHLSILALKGEWGFAPLDGRGPLSLRSVRSGWLANAVKGSRPETGCRHARQLAREPEAWSALDQERRRGQRRIQNSDG